MPTSHSPGSRIAIYSMPSVIKQYNPAGILKTNDSGEHASDNKRSFDSLP